MISVARVKQTSETTFRTKNNNKLQFKKSLDRLEKKFSTITSRKTFQKFCQEKYSLSVSVLYFLNESKEHMDKKDRD